MGNNQKPEILYDVDKVSSKKLSVLYKITEVLHQKLELNVILQRIANLIPEAFPVPSEISSRIIFDGMNFTCDNFNETQWLERCPFEIPEKKQGYIELFYTRQFIDHIDKEFLFRETEFLQNLATLIMGVISRDHLEKLLYDNTERLKELKGINRTTEILQTGATLEESLQEICSFLPEAWQYPQFTVSRIIYEDKIFTSENFKETPWVQKQVFETPDRRKGVIEVYYLKEFPELFEGPFLKEERSLIDNLAALISGSATKNSLKELLINNTERLKELRGINKTSEILKQSNTVEESLQIICSILPEAWQYPESTVARITFENKVFESDSFAETEWCQSQNFEAPGKRKGKIEIFYLKEFPVADEGPFLKEERHLLINLANLIAGSAAKDVFYKLLNENKERLKELWAINQTSRLIAEGRPVAETLQELALLLPKSWQYPKHTVAKITYDGNSYKSKNFMESRWFQKENFVTINNKKGTIQINYLKEFPKIYEGPFLKEERHLIINIGKLISGYLNNIIGREMYRKNILPEKTTQKTDEFRKKRTQNNKPLRVFYNQQSIDKYIYLDMMKFKVKEILFVATLYDAFILENEDSFFERFMGEIYQYSLFSLPRITGVSSPDEALHLLETTSFDLVILMVGIDRVGPVELSKKIKEKKPDLQVYLLLNQTTNLKYFEEVVTTIRTIDRLFVWNGDSQIFFAMVKSTEDKANVENDTKIGLVRIILLVEDSADYYSRYLQMLYSIVFGQIQQILPEVEKNELDKIVKMRSRPKILLATNYEDAVYYINKYKDFLLCMISDVEFEFCGQLNKSAGIKLIKYAQDQITNLPVILQSNEPKNKRIADDLNLHFIDKNSERLINDLKDYLEDYLGFGDFIFRNQAGKQLAVAKSLKEFEKLLPQIPAESYYTHAIKNQFSLWLMARGEIHLARTLNPVKVEHFKSMDEMKIFFINLIREYREEKKKGKVLSYEEVGSFEEKNIITLSSGSLGGKGRGLAFINSLIYNQNFPGNIQGIYIRTPLTAIIGTDEFEAFIERNKLFNKITQKGIPFHKIQKDFLNSYLSPELKEKLEAFINKTNKPIAVRSSAISEDSFTRPFAGVFDTFIVPNTTTDKKYVLTKLFQAIKLVYASIFSDSAKSYFKTIKHKTEEEKMAVILQELVGNQYGNYYFPHISGIAQSYNYYPVAHMRPEEGFAVAAVGLGKYVVEGWNSYRFSPKYPNIEMFTTKDLINSSQVKFFAVNCAKHDIDFVKDGDLATIDLLDIGVAEKLGTLKHSVSVYNLENDRVEVGLGSYGPRIVNFAEILKYKYIPLAETIEVMLSTITEAFGCPVEIEFAVDLDKTLNKLPSFYLLQIKPLVVNQLNFDVEFNNVDKTKLLLYTQSSLGNGEIKDIEDIVFIKTERFDKLKTMEMVNEVEYFNDVLQNQNRNYVLIGPGRWGTRDQYLGIPVAWSQISHAKVIVEISLANYPLDSSLGSHFFHNVTSMNIGYFSVLDTSRTDFIKWEVLNNQELVDETKYFKHVRFKKPITILMDGKKRISAIINNSW